MSGSLVYPVEETWQQEACEMLYKNKYWQGIKFGELVNRQV